MRLVQWTSLLLILLAIGCRPYVNDVPFDPVKNSYFQKTYEEQAKEFEKYDMEEQYQLVRYGCERIHHTPWCVIELFANRGPDIIPLLTQRLNTTQLDSEIYDISLILFEVTIEAKPYGPAYDPELLKLLHKRADGMRPGPRQELTLGRITRIEKDIRERLESAAKESEAKSNDSSVLDQEKDTASTKENESDHKSGEIHE